LPIEKEYARNVYWMYFVVLKDIAKKSRVMVMKALSKKGIETREAFVPFNMQTALGTQIKANPSICPVATQIGKRGFYIPSGAGLTHRQLKYVVASLKEILGT